MTAFMVNALLTLATFELSELYCCYDIYADAPPGGLSTIEMQEVVRTLMARVNVYNLIM